MAIDEVGRQILAGVLKQLRTDSGFSQGDVARYVGWRGGASMVSRIETGTQVVSAGTALTLLKALVTENDLHLLGQVRELVPEVKREEDLQRLVEQAQEEGWASERGAPGFITDLMGGEVPYATVYSRMRKRG